MITGGTIDKVYDKRTGVLTFKNTQLLKMLERSRAVNDVVSELLFLKDSLAMDENDRHHILERCLESPQQHILITHGTDTMVKTAHLLGENIQHKTIVLFGAMTPYTINNSEALFNFGFAMSAVQTQGTGVYIAMNGKIFNFDQVVKNQDTSLFCVQEK